MQVGWWGSGLACCLGICTSGSGEIGKRAWSRPRCRAGGSISSDRKLVAAHHLPQTGRGWRGGFGRTPKPHIAGQVRDGYRTKSDFVPRHQTRCFHGRNNENLGFRRLDDKDCFRPHNPLVVCSNHTCSMPGQRAMWTRLRNPQSSTCFRLFGGETDGTGETLGRLRQSRLRL